MMTCTTVPEVIVVATEPEAIVCVLYTRDVVVGIMTCTTLPDVMVAETEPVLSVSVV